MGDALHTPSSAFTAAELAYQQHLRRLERGEPGDLEGLCRAHPELAEELRELDAGYLRARAALGGLAGGAEAQEPVAEVVERLTRPAEAGDLEDRGRVALGGMGEIRRVWDARLGRTLAMKVLPLERLAERGPAQTRRRVERFLEEAHIAAGLQHPSIVPVHALGASADGRLYFTMPLIEGQDLRSAIERAHAGDEEWSVPRVLSVVARVCEAMAYAHARGVVHRDLKPANVMVGRFGEVYVMDWGLAKVLGSADRRDIRPRVGMVGGDPGGHGHGELHTMDGDVLGTPGYMPPEQAEGRVEEVGARSDVYSVGCMLYHLLSGRAPYADTEGRSRSALEVLELVRNGPPEPLSEVAPRASPELVAICERAMQRDPERRYGDMQALARDLRAWLEGRVVRAYETGAWAELRKWLERNRALALALAGIVVAVVAGSAGIAWVQTRAGDRLRSTNVRLEEANLDLEAARGVAERRLASLQRSLYFNNVALAHNAFESFNTANLRALLAECPPELRGWEWRYLDRLSESSLRTLEGHAHFVVDVEFTPDGRRLVSASRDGTIGIWSVEDGRRLRTIRGHDDMVEDVDVSPDGRRLASCGRDRTVRVWDLESGAELVRLEGHTDMVRGVAFSPDGRRLVSGAFDDAVILWDVEQRRAIARLPGEQSDVLCLDWSPDGRRIAAGSFDGRLLVWDADSLALLRDLPAGGDFRINQVRFSADGERIAVASQGRVLRIWDLQSGAAVRSFQARTGAYTVDFLPDGRRLVADEFGALQLWDLETEQRRAAFLGHGATIHAAVVSPDGRRVASGSADGTLRLWDVTRDPARMSLEAIEDNVHAVAFSPDGCLLAWGGRDGTVQLRDAGSGAWVAGWDAGQSWIIAVAFSPDGRRIASGGSDGSVCIWDVATGALERYLRAHGGWVRFIDFDREGTRMLTASQTGEAKVWDLERGVELARAEQVLGLVRAEFDPSGQRVLISGWDGWFRVWDATLSELLLEVAAHPEGATFATFSPDGRRIASGSGDRRIRIWDAASGALQLEALGHEHSVTGVRFSRDGERLYSCGWDGMFKVWDALTGTLAMTLQPDEYPLRNLDVSPDGESIAVCGVGPRIHVWSAAGR